MGQEKKGNQIGKEEIKWSLFTDDMILKYRKPSKFWEKKTVRIINKFRKVAVYKINMPNQLPNVKRKFFFKSIKKDKIPGYKIKQGNEKTHTWKL